MHASPKSSAVRLTKGAVDFDAIKRWQYREAAIDVFEICVMLFHAVENPRYSHPLPNHRTPTDPNDRTEYTDALLSALTAENTFAQNLYFTVREGCHTSGSQANSTTTTFHSVPAMLEHPSKNISPQLDSGRAHDRNKDDSTFNRLFDEHIPSAAKLPRNEMQSLVAANMLPVSSQVLTKLRGATDEQDHIVASAAVIQNTKVGLQSLSNELLSNLALHLCGSRTILSFSLVNKRFRAIAQDVMLRRLCIPKGGLLQVLDMLGTNLEALPKVCHLDLRQHDSHNSYCKCSDSFDLNARITQRFCDTVESNHNHDVTWGRIQDAKRNSNIWYNKPHSLILDILVASLPSLREVTMWLPPTGDAVETNPIIPLFHRQNASFAPFDSLTLEVMQMCLRVLTIESDAKYPRNVSHVISMPGFRNLRSLTMSMEHLGSPIQLTFYSPDDTLETSSRNNNDVGVLSKAVYWPLTLTDIHLTSCNKFTFNLLETLGQVPSVQPHPIHVTLDFDIPASSALILCAMEGPTDHPGRTASIWTNTLADLDSKGYRVDFSTKGTLPVCMNGRKATFMEELQAMTKLSLGEVARIGRAGMQFSDCVAQSYNGPRTRSSPLEYKLFLLHGGDYPTLFSSPTFTATSWVHAAFFHGASGAESKPKTSSMIECLPKRHVDYEGAKQLRYVPSKSRRRRRIGGVHANLSGFVFPYSVHCRLLSKLQPLSEQFSVLGNVIKIPAPSTLRSSRYGVKRDAKRRMQPSSLIFDSSKGDLTAFFDHTSMFAEQIFAEEDWKRYFQPSERPSREKKRQGARSKRAKSAHLEEKKQRR
ncbi:hypothetical protein OPT61_g4996 [Boeremia exigua]|uniref:Uncharacterized protein n=1 Tax=Boeremia exigua TaxID=749465 RepID=A0ACC2IC10_9PLEO|nr:hypothetical protein OPT61_g4996 [Boeremia exigua]